LPDYFNCEIEYSKRGYNLIAGVDEVGRGAIAGPLLAGAVIFNHKKSFKYIEEIKDSKKLSAKKRASLAEIIKKEAENYSTGSVDSVEIDKIGIGAANILAFKRALDGLKKFDLALIDGRLFRGLGCRYFCLTKGEDKSISIAAASIIAKVERDKIMGELDQSNKYHFANNKGYGSSSHISAIKKYGLSEYHRKTFFLKTMSHHNLTLF